MAKGTIVVIVVLAIWFVLLGKDQFTVGTTSDTRTKADNKPADKTHVPDALQKVPTIDVDEIMKGAKPVGGGAAQPQRRLAT